MNSIWNAAANEVGNVLHAAAAHPFGAFCWIGAAALVTVGVTSIIREKIKDHREYLEEKAKADAIPNPPLMKLTSRTETPGTPR